MAETKEKEKVIAKEKEFEPIQISDDIQLRIALKTFQKSNYVDIRQFWKPEDKIEYLPTKKGVTIHVEDTIEELLQLHKNLTEIIEMIKDDYCE